MISFLCAVEVIEIMTRMLCVFFFRFIKESNQEDEKYSAFFLLLLKQTLKLLHQFSSFWVEQCIQQIINLFLFFS